MRTEPLDFRILGPLEVVAGTESLALGAPKQRALLALLILHRNEALSAERLIDRLWGEHAPKRARAALQLYVAELRKLVGRERIETHGHAYVLDVGEGELDAERAERLLAQAKRSPPHGALTALDAGLSLWRGEPLPELAADARALGEIAWLGELRLELAELRVETRLELGEGGEVVGELERIVAENPLRERPRGQLMVALYRAGRPAEALAAYAAARDALVDELGIEPSPALRELQRQILSHDPSLTTASADAAPWASRRASTA